MAAFTQSVSRKRVYTSYQLSHGSTGSLKFAALSVLLDHVLITFSFKDIFNSYQLLDIFLKTKLLCYRLYSLYLPLITGFSSTLSRSSSQVVTLGIGSELAAAISIETLFTFFSPMHSHTLQKKKKVRRGSREGQFPSRSAKVRAQSVIPAPVLPRPGPYNRATTRFSANFDPKK